MTPSEADISDDFDRWCGKYGWAYQDDPDEPNNGLLMSSADAINHFAKEVNLQWARAGIPRSIEAALLSSPTYNAAASMGGPDRYYIGVFCGKLQRVISELQSIYDSAPGVQPEPPASRSLIAGSLFAAEFKVHLHLTLFHELGHIAKGHVALGVSLGRDTLETRQQTLTPMDQQTLEMDADLGAVDGLLCRFVGFSKRVTEEGPQYSLPTDVPLRVVLRRLSLVTMVIYHWAVIAERLGGHDNPAPGTIVTGAAHPPPSVRLRFIVDNIATMFTKHMRDCSGVTVDSLMMAAVGGIFDRETLLAIREGRPRQSDLLSDRAFVWRYQATLMNNFLLLRPLIAPHAIGPLAPSKEWPLDPPPGYV